MKWVLQFSLLLFLLVLMFNLRYDLLFQNIFVIVTTYLWFENQELKKYSAIPFVLVIVLVSVLTLIFGIATHFVNMVWGLIVFLTLLLLMSIGFGLLLTHSKKIWIKILLYLLIILYLWVVHFASLKMNQYNIFGNLTF